MKPLLLNAPGANRLRLKERLAKPSKAAFMKVLSFAVIINLFPTIAAYGDFATEPIQTNIESFIPSSSLTAPALPVRIPKKVTVVATGYSSTVDQTDNTPFVTAANEYVRPGIVAATPFLPLHTKIKMPEFFGDNVLDVKDRMNRRYDDEYRIDVWFESYADAKAFGVKETEILIF